MFSPAQAEITIGSKASSANAQIACSGAQPRRIKQYRVRRGGSRRSLANQQGAYLGGEGGEVGGGLAPSLGPLWEFG